MRTDIDFNQSIVDWVGNWPNTRFFSMPQLRGLQYSSSAKMITDRSWNWTVMEMTEVYRNISLFRQLERKRKYINNTAWRFLYSDLVHKIKMEIEDFSIQSCTRKYHTKSWQSKIKKIPQELSTGKFREWKRKAVSSFWAGFIDVESGFCWLSCVSFADDFSFNL